MKKWGHLCSFHISFLSYGPSIVQKRAFFQFCADFSKKLKSVDVIYIYAIESCHYTASENSMVNRVLSHRL